MGLIGGQHFDDDLVCGEPRDLLVGERFRFGDGLADDDPRRVRDEPLAQRLLPVAPYTWARRQGVGLGQRP